MIHFLVVFQSICSFMVRVSDILLLHLTLVLFMSILEICTDFLFNLWGIWFAVELVKILVNLRWIFIYDKYFFRQSWRFDLIWVAHEKLVGALVKSNYNLLILIMITKNLVPFSGSFILEDCENRINLVKLILEMVHESTIFVDWFYFVENVV